MALGTAARTRHRRLVALALGALLLASCLLAGAAQARIARSGGHVIGLADARHVGGRTPCQSLIRSRAAANLPARCRQRTSPLPAASNGPLYWGGWIGSQLTGEEAPWDMGAVNRFEELAGKRASLVNFGAPFANCSTDPCSFYSFPTEPMESIRAHGAIPFFSWSSQSIPAQVEEPDFQLGDVIAGTYDTYIREFAEAARAWGHPFFLRFDWEMNANWFEWSEGVNGNNAGEFVAAWRHVHDIFTAVGATNATWVWCPYVDPNERLPDIAALYPGPEYVDWTGLDGYNWGTNPASPKGWKTFDELFGATYERITEAIAPGKPMVIAETGTSEYGGSKAAWIEEALESARTKYPDLHALLWFEKYDDGMDWPIETSPAATAAFAAGIQAPAYVTNAFAGLETAGPIPPPSA